MRTTFLLVCSLLATPSPASEAPPRYSIAVNVADRVAFQESVTLPPKSSQRIRVSETLSVDLHPWGPGDNWIEAVVVSTVAGKEHRIGGLQKPPRQAGSLTHLAFSVCGERIIALEREAPGRCADLLPMAKPDPVFGSCEGYCTGPYEGMPDRIPNGTTRIAPANEVGTKLVITGRTLDPEGYARAGIVIYAYQTNNEGVYPPADPPRGSFSNHHGKLRAWVRSGTDGRYTFETVRPGSYGGNPEHIHMHVIEPGCATYQIDDVMFTGEPNLEGLLKRPGWRTATPVAGSGIVSLSESGSGLKGTRDIHLGMNVKGYTGCDGKRSKSPN